MRRHYDRPLWHKLESALFWPAALCGCIMFWVWLVGKIGAVL